MAYAASGFTKAQVGTVRLDVKEGVKPEVRQSSNIDPAAPTGSKDIQPTSRPAALMPVALDTVPAPATNRTLGLATEVTLAIVPPTAPTTIEEPKPADPSGLTTAGASWTHDNAKIEEYIEESIKLLKGIEAHSKAKSEALRSLHLHLGDFDALCRDHDEILEVLESHLEDQDATLGELKKCPSSIRVDDVIQKLKEVSAAHGAELWETVKLASSHALAVIKPLYPRVELDAVCDGFAADYD
uniref:Uncharacterized protein n=1 Tax=Oryza brachyantha TaxID=4533 RepID=J3MWB3_ORYBR